MVKEKIKPIEFLKIPYEISDKSDKLKYSFSFSLRDSLCFYFFNLENNFKEGIFFSISQYSKKFNQSIEHIEECLKDLKDNEIIYIYSKNDDDKLIFLDIQQNKSIIQNIKNGRMVISF